MQARGRLQDSLRQSREALPEPVADQHHQIGAVARLAEAGDHPSSLLQHRQIGDQRRAVAMIDGAAGLRRQPQRAAHVRDIAAEAGEYRQPCRGQPLGAVGECLIQGRGAAVDPGADLRRRQRGREGVLGAVAAMAVYGQSVVAPQG